MDEEAEIIWRPTGNSTALDGFMSEVGIGNWRELLDWSVSDLNDFWQRVTSHLGVIWHVPPLGGLALADGTMPGAKWFPGSRLNYAEHALRRAAVAPLEPAIIAHSQTREPVTLSWAGLARDVARASSGLRRLGVEQGDRVAAIAPNVPETVVLFLATASIGAVWSSCPPEFGVRSIVDRLGPIGPKVLLATDGYRYGDKTVDRRSDVEEICASLPTLEHVVYLRYLGLGPDGWSDLLGRQPPDPLEFASVPFDHPLYILFSSGTTGLPKAIVHGHGGITVEHLKALVLHADLGETDRFFWFTTTGWMMWNYLVSGLLAGSTLVLFDGDPGHPDLSTLWRLADEVGCTFFGTSAPFITACQKDGLAPGSGGRLPAVRTVGSTGAPLPTSAYRWIRDFVGREVHVTSIAGGTDVCTAFVGMVPVLPVRAGVISTRFLGCAVEAYDESGQPVPAGVTGELVVTAPMPSMPVGLWGDTDGSRLRSTYFERYPGVWHHGDWIRFDVDGGCVITGRSDATLNRGGVRLGTSDFYTVVEAIPGVLDSLIVHVEPTKPGGAGDLRLFVVLDQDTELDDDLQLRIRRELRAQLSPRHSPDQIEQVPAVPRTSSGKKLEVPVKRILAGERPSKVVAPGALADPTSLDWFITASATGHTGNHDASSGGNRK